jgi:hypothetical protein
MGRRSKSSPAGNPLWATRREQLLAQAKATQTLEPVAQRDYVYKVIFESVLTGACTWGEILEAAYHDPEGRRFWDFWLFEPMHIYHFAELLALASTPTHGVSVLDRNVSQISERLRAAAVDRETWLIGDTIALIEKTSTSFDLRNSTAVVRPREAIAWMLRNPNARHLIPPVLAQLVASEPTNTPIVDSRRVSELGKRPRIKVYLGEHYPQGVPAPAYCPRKNLRSELLVWDKGLALLDEGTLKLAVDEFNSDLKKRSAHPNSSESDPIR